MTPVDLLLWGMAAAVGVFALGTAVCVIGFFAAAIRDYWRTY